MKLVSHRIMLAVITALLVFSAYVSTAAAREVITIKNANGGTYNVTAYNTSTKSYYYINGSLSSDSHGITVPNGYGCTITVTKGRAVGNRNLYEKNDPLNPIFDVVKKSTYVLELKYLGKKSAGTPMPQSAGGQNLRQAPPGQ